MKRPLNLEQAKGLANFFFDVAKGVVLGTLGTSIAIPQALWYIRFMNIFVGLGVTYICLKLALGLLEE